MEEPMSGITPPKRKLEGSIPIDGGQPAASKRNKKSTPIEAIAGQGIRSNTPSTPAFPFVANGNQAHSSNVAQCAQQILHQTPSHPPHPSFLFPMASPHASSHLHPFLARPPTPLPPPRVSAPRIPSTPAPLSQ